MKKKETARLEKQKLSRRRFSRKLDHVGSSAGKAKPLKKGETHLLIIGIGNENRQSSTTTGTGLIVRGERIGGTGI